MKIQEANLWYNLLNQLLILNFIFALKWIWLIRQINAFMQESKYSNKSK